MTDEVFKEKLIKVLNELVIEMIKLQEVISDIKIQKIVTNEFRKEIK